MEAFTILQILHKEAYDAAMALRQAQKKRDVAQSNFYLGQQHAFVLAIKLLTNPRGKSVAQFKAAKSVTTGQKVRNIINAVFPALKDHNRLEPSVLSADNDFAVALPPEIIAVIAENTALIEQIKVENAHLRRSLKHAVNVFSEQAAIPVADETAQTLENTLFSSDEKIKS